MKNYLDKELHIIFYTAQMRKHIYLYLILLILAMGGCTYSVFLNAYPHLKTVQVSSFENATSEYALAQDLQNQLVERFQNSGRLKISTLNPDSQIEGGVLDYKNEILSYDINGNISEYRVSILLSIQMTDLKLQQVMYENKSLLVTENYSPNTENQELSRTEAQAQAKIYEKVFDTIIRNTLEAW